MRAFGMPLPADLVEFEKELEAQFAATKRAAKKRLAGRARGHWVDLLVVPRPPFDQRYTA